MRYYIAEYLKFKKYVKVIDLSVPGDIIQPFIGAL